MSAERLDHVVAGALFDFLGWLTTREKRLCLSSGDFAPPAVEALTEFAALRGLDLDHAMVEQWNMRCGAQPAPEDGG